MRAMFVGPIPSALTESRQDAIFEALWNAMVFATPARRAETTGP